jgi:hypothetical protein
VKPTSNLPPLSAGVTADCAVAAVGTAQASGDTLPSLRTALQTPGGASLPASLLKHADEQTVVGLAAVFEAIRAYGLTKTAFADWGVLAGPRFLGRACLAVALQRFAQEGAWGVSPHLIPHRSLHSVSGTISQALGIRGPNFGVGGGPHSAAETLLVASALITDGQLPGLWVVVSGWDPEPILEQPNMPSVNGFGPAHSVYRAAALALTTLRPDWNGLRLQVHAEAARTRLDGFSGGMTVPMFQMEPLLEALQTRRLPATWRLGCGGWLELRGGPAGAENVT